MTGTKRFVRIYPSDLKRFVIASLGMVGYILILSVLNDIVLIRYGDNSFTLSLINSSFFSLVLLPSILFSSKVEKGKINLNGRVLSLFAQIEIALFLSLVTYFISSDPLFVILLSIVILAVSRIPFLRRLSKKNITLTNGITTKLSVEASNILSKPLITLTVIILTYYYGIIPAILSSMAMIIIITVGNVPRMKLRYDKVFSSIGWLLLVLLVVGVL